MTINKNLLCMKWDEFNNFVVAGLANLYQRDEMADVTLYCDGRSFKAHRTILSIWSPYFKEILATNTHPHPVIILQDTVVSDLELILRFIYQGHLYVPYEDAERFLKTADHFQVAGLKSMRMSPPASQPPPHMNGHASHQSHTTAGSGGSLGSNVPNDLSTSSCNSRTQILQPPYGPSVGTSFTPIVINSGSSSSVSPGVSYRISSNDVPSSFNSSIQQQSHSAVSSSYPMEIARPNPSVSNVIKPHPRVIQNETTVMRPSSPVMIGQSSTSIPSQAFQPLPLRNSDKLQNSDRMLYQQNPQSVLIVHNPSSSHNGYQSLKDTTLLGKQSDTVVVLENAASIPPGHGASALHNVNSGNSGCNTYTVYNNLGTQTQILNNAAEEEVLGLSYMHDQGRAHNHHQQSHSQVIPDEAVAGGVNVEDNEHIPSNSASMQYTSPAAHSSTVAKSFNKDDEVVIVSASSSQTPVYAVKRNLALTNETRSPATSKPSTSRGSMKDKINKIVKGKQKSDSITKVQPKLKVEQSPSSSTEYTNCPKCKKSVKISSLKVHMKRTHLDEGTILTCPICDKQIRSKGVYYKHMYLHRQKLPDNDSGKQKAVKYSE